MAADDGSATSRLINKLLTQAPRFSFAQLVVLLEGAIPGRVPVGYLGPAEREALRFRLNPSMAFPSSDVHAVRAPGAAEHAPSRHYQVLVNFLGLSGSVSPLPPFYAEEIGWDGDEDDAVRDFLDVFHHRLLSLFYRGWKKYRYYIQYQPGAVDAYSRWLLSLVGLGHLRLGEETSLDGDRLLAYLGLLSMRSHSASMLAGIVSHYFDGVPVEVVQCVPRRVAVPDHQRCALGRANTTLAGDMVLGSHGVDRGSTFRLVLGPLSQQAFFCYLPAGRHFRPLRALIRFVLSGFLEYDVELLLQQGGGIRLELSVDCPCRLGWSSWLGHHDGGPLSVLLPGRLAA